MNSFSAVRWKTSRGVSVILLVIAILLFTFECGLCGQTVLSGKVKKVIDGDSFLLECGEAVYEIRMWGIDCPEYDQPFAREARKMSRRYLLGKKIEVEVKYTDKYDRLIGIARSGKDIINANLVEHGGAWVYRRYCKASICKGWKKLEEKARVNSKGLWREENPIPPWKWRKRKS